MGQHANARAWAEFERRQRKAQDDYFEAEPPITDDELAEIASDKHFERVDYPRTNRSFGGW